MTIKDFQYCRLICQQHKYFQHVLSSLAFFEKLHRRLSIPKLFKVKHVQLLSSYVTICQKRTCILLVWIVPNNSYTTSFNHGDTYLYDLRIPLISIWFRFTQKLSEAAHYHALCINDHSTSLSGIITLYIVYFIQNLFIL